MALYNFTDTIERAYRADLPSEALNFNGVFLEHEIDGYRTLNVMGREALESEIDAIETKARHGARYRSRRHMPRIITVIYQLSANTPLELMEKFNKLNFILDAEEAMLIFNDEPGKYFVGTKQNLKPPKEGSLTTRGEIEFYCADPFKYSVAESKVEAKDGAIIAIYNGTVPNPPKITILAHSNVNSMEFLKDTARLSIGLSYGSGSGASGPSQELLYINVKDSSSQVVNHNWIANIVPITLAPCIEQMVAIANNSHLSVEYDSVADEYHYDDDYANTGFGFGIYTRLHGTWWAARQQSLRPYLIELNRDGYVIKNRVAEPGDIVSKDDIWDIAQYSIIGSGVQYDLVNTYGAMRQNFTFEWEAEIYADGPLQRGAQVFTLYREVVETQEPEEEGADPVEVVRQIPMFGVCVKRETVGANRLEVVVYMGEDVADTIIMRADSANSVFGINPLPCSISRFGTTYTLKLGNDEYSYQTDGGTPIPSYLTVYILDYNGSPALHRNVLGHIRYTEHTAASVKGITNRIKEDDEIVLDCATAEITLNGILEPSLGDIANEWDAMELSHGENGIGVHTVCDGKEPKVTMTYREAFL